MTTNTKWTATLLTLAVLTASPVPAQTGGGSAPLNAPIQLPTGLAITPTAAPHSVLQLLNPGIPTLPDFTADHPVTTALSPDGSQLLVLTSGLSLTADPGYAGLSLQTNEYVFVYGTAVYPLRARRAALPVPNTFCGLAWNPRRPGVLCLGRSRRSDLCLRQERLS